MKFYSQKSSKYSLNFHDYTLINVLETESFNFKYNWNWTWNNYKDWGRYKRLMSVKIDFLSNLLKPDYQLQKSSMFLKSAEFQNL